MTEPTRIPGSIEPFDKLRAEGQGVALVADELLPRVYAELQSLARGKMAVLRTGLPTRHWRALWKPARTGSMRGLAGTVRAATLPV